MANPATSADKTAQTNEEIISVEATEIPQIEAQAQPVVQLPNGGVLMGNDLFLIGAPSVRQYPATKKGSTLPHTFANQDYYLFPLNGKVFTTRDKSFAEAHKTGNLYSVTMGERIEGQVTYLELVNYATKTQKLAQIEFDSKVAMSNFRIKQLEAFDPSKSQADANLVNSLLAGVLQ